MRIQEVREVQRHGCRIGRAGLSLRVIELVAAFREDPTYKGAMELAGRLKVIACAASQDEYWREQVGRGEARELRDIARVMAPAEGEG